MNQLKEMNWRLRVFDSLSYPTRVLKPNGTILAVNKRFLEIFGGEMAETVGKNCRDVIPFCSMESEPPCDHDKACPLRKTLSTRLGHSVLIHYVDRKGEKKWQDCVFSPIIGEDGVVECVIESIRDVTRFKTLEKDYSEIRVLVDNVVLSSFSAIMAANRKGKIMLMNPAAERLFGYTQQEADAANIEDFYPSGVAREIMRKLRDPAIGGKGKLPITKVNIITRFGEEIPVEITAAILYEEGMESGTTAIFNDLREKLAVEEKLKNAQEQVMQTEKMASLGRLAAGVAHEINNPLTSILMYSNIVYEKLANEDPLRQNLAYIIEDGERCKDIVKNLLAYSRQTSLKKEVFSVNVLVEESLRLIRDQKLFMHVEVVKDLVSSPLYVSGDKKQLCQVIINLIFNAIDAMGGEGRLIFRTFGTRGSGKVFLEIEDTGSGIPQENLVKIFDPFFTTKTPGKGTGLGLSMAYGVLEENGGRISVKRTSPDGTVILLELPVMEDSGGVLFDSIG